jgi:hypothetical protein
VYPRWAIEDTKRLKWYDLRSARSVSYGLICILCPGLGVHCCSLDFVLFIPFSFKTPAEVKLIKVEGKALSQHVSKGSRFSDKFYLKPEVIGLSDFVRLNAIRD